MSNHAFQAPSPEALAALLPQFDIEFFIAQGGMGAVYKARQRSLDRDVAIKVLPPEVGQNEEFRDSFISEAKAMARLNHPNLLGVYDYGTVDGMPYIVMEYVSGGSLHQAAYAQAVELAQAASIVKAICAGLAHAHENGIVHRDIKPSNILLTQKVEPKVADFGLAHAADSDTPGLMMGTPGYTAPEVFHDPAQAGVLADVYSVGVILHQLLSGLDPAGSMEPPSAPSGSLRLDAIWRKATNLNPALRYPSVAAMEADIDRWLSTKPKAAPPVPGRPGRPGMPGRAARMQPVAPEGGGFMGKFVLIVILIALIVIAYQLLKTGKEERAETVPQPVTQPVAPAPIPDPQPENLSPPSMDETSFRKPEPIPEPEPEEEEEEPEDIAETDEEPEEPEPGTPVKREPGDPELLQRAIGLIGDARKDRGKELADNVSALHFGLKALSRDAEPDVLLLVDQIKEDIVDSRIPIIDRVYGLPDKMAAAFKDSLAKEESIDTGYQAALTRIRDAYVTRLQGAAEAATDDDLKARLLAQAEDAGDLNAWIASLSPEPERVVKRSFAGRPGEGEGFVGSWDVHTAREDRVGRWVGHPDGRVVVDGQDWEVTWEILEDGALRVNWPNGKKPHVMQRDGDGWVGENGFGKRVEFRRAD